MKIVGYGDKLSVAAGERIEFKVSCEEDGYDAVLVRPAHLERFRRELDSDANGSYAGRPKTFEQGSYVCIGPPVPRPEALRIELWVFPTAPTRGEQELLVWSGGDGLFVNSRGEVELRSGAGAVAVGAPLAEREWHRISANLAAGSAAVEQVPLRWGEAARGEGSLAANPATDEHLWIGRLFDGKIDSPRIEGVASWDFSIGIQTTKVTDTGPKAMHGEIVNMPMRAVTGWNWDGRSVDFKQAPSQYGAIHFHSDDLDDAGWETDFHLDVPDDLPSDLYALRLRAGGEEDHVPFFVRPAPGQKRARIAFLAPTFSYLAYSCESSGIDGVPVLEEERRRMREAQTPADHYPVENGLLSLYDSHSDGSGCAFVSRLRPITNMRPYYRAFPIWGPHQLGADLHVLDWLRNTEEAYDVLTDEDLHRDGIESLDSYRVVLSGTHPEYWSGRMLDAVEQFLQAGGRFMYLGGNGMYWVTDPHPERPHMVEVRRTHQGTRAWESAPGECFQQSTGEPGGLWRYRGRPPNALVGVGMAGQGFDAAIPYRRRPESYDERVAWIFDGVGEDGPIGDFGATLGGAAGFEVDRFDHSHGTPEGTILLATAKDGFSDSYQGVVEDVLIEDSRSGGPVNPRLRADMTLLEYPNGGAVFSTGSICWGTSLTHHDCQNNVARITGNVLRRFARD